MSISVSCTIPSIPGVNAPALPQNTRSPQVTEATQPAAKEDTSGKKESKDEKTGEDKLLVENNVQEGVLTQTMYGR